MQNSHKNSLSKLTKNCSKHLHLKNFFIVALILNQPRPITEFTAFMHFTGACGSMKVRHNHGSSFTIHACMHACNVMYFFLLAAPEQRFVLVIRIVVFILSFVFFALSLLFEFTLTSVYSHTELKMPHSTPPQKKNNKIINLTLINPFCKFKKNWIKILNHQYLHIYAYKRKEL